MEDLYEHLHGATSKDGRPILTARQLLGKEEGIAYFNSANALIYIRSLRPAELSDFGQVLSFMREGLRIVGNLSPRKDRGKRMYIYPNAQSENATVGAKYILEGGSIPFFKDYCDRKFVINFTLEELVEEAMND